MANPETLRELLERGDERTRYIRRIFAAWREGFARGREVGLEEGYARAEADMAAAWYEAAHPIARPAAYRREVAARNLRAAEAAERRDQADHERAFIALAWATPAHMRSDVQRAIVQSCPPPERAPRRRPRAAERVASA